MLKLCATMIIFAAFWAIVFWTLRLIGGKSQVEPRHVKGIAFDREISAHPQPILPIFLSTIPLLVIAFVAHDATGTLESRVGLFLFFSLTALGYGYLVAAIREKATHD